jgi:hypothetical protein
MQQYHVESVAEGTPGTVQTWLGHPGASHWLVVVILLSDIHPFLAVYHPINARVLAIKGWIHDYGVTATVKEFNTDHYQLIYTTGGPVERPGEFFI